MSKSNRTYQQQLNYLSYPQLMDITTIDADYQYEEWKSKVDDVVAEFQKLEKCVEKHKNIFTQK